jgi:hypothetical protein
VRHALVTLLTLLCLAPAAAHAATVSVGPASCFRGDCTQGALVRDDAGESNDLSVSVSPSRTELVVSDRGAPLHAGEGCAARPDGSVACALDPRAPIGVTVFAGGGDDDVVAGRETSADLGPGNDRLTGPTGVGGDGDDVLTAAGGSAAYLTGGAGADRLVGGPGPDVLHGGGGPDVLEGADGADRIVVSDGEPDRADGGAGDDIASYEASAAAVRVDLADPAPDGAEGEGDVLRGFESATGGAGDDRLVGDEGPNVLDGGPGSDVLLGRGGDDSLSGGSAFPLGRPALDAVFGGAGADRLTAESAATLDGGTGNDRIEPGFTARRAWAACGDGRDSVLVAPFMHVEGDAACEVLRVGVPGVRSGRADLRRVTGALRVRLPCPRFVRRSCRASVELRDPRSGRRRGGVRRRIAPGRSRTLAVRAAAGAAALHVTIVVPGTARSTARADVVLR